VTQEAANVKQFSYSSVAAAGFFIYKFFLQEIKQNVEKLSSGRSGSAKYKQDGKTYSTSRTPCWWAAGAPCMFFMVFYMKGQSGRGAAVHRMSG
jgi:hypothetical protein